MNILKLLKNLFFPQKQNKTTTTYEEVEQINIFPEKEDKTAIAYHEAGHCIVAYILAYKSNKVVLDLLTIDKKTANAIIKGADGGLKFKTTSNDYRILIACAGMCARTIFTNGIETTQQNISKFKDDISLLDREGASDDYECIKGNIDFVGVPFNTKGKYVMWSAFRWVLEYLLIPEVWKATEILANALLEAPTNTLNRQKIVSLMKKSGFNEYLRNNKEQLLAKRYPLSQETLRRV